MIKSDLLSKIRQMDTSILDDPELKKMIRKDNKHFKELEKQRLKAKKFNSLLRASPALIGLILGWHHAKKRTSRAKNQYDTYRQLRFKDVLRNYR